MYRNVQPHTTPRARRLAAAWPYQPMRPVVVRRTLIVLGLLLGLVPLLGSKGTAAQPTAAVAIPRPDHVVVVIEENHAYNQIIGSPSAPYINGLAASHVSFTDSHAIEHPSQPNYLDLFSGGNQGVTDDSCPHTFAAANLGSELIGAGLTFAGYSEDLPGVGSPVCGSGGYARKHSPWINFTNVPTADHLPWTSFPTNYASLPTIAFVIPNLTHDMHDGSIQQGDTWLQQNLDGYAQWAQSHNSLLIVTWDEDDFTNVNQIATIFVGPMTVAGQYSETINHYNVLRTLEDMYGLPYAGHSATASPITDVWTGGAPPPSTAVPPTATAVPPTVTSVPPTRTAVPPTATSAPPTATAVPPTRTPVPPSATSVPPTATWTATAVAPTNTATGVPPSATNTVSSTPTSLPPTGTLPPDTATATDTPAGAPTDTPAPATSTPVSGCASVEWTNLANAVAAGGSIKKTGQNRAWDSEGDSTAEIPAGDGSLRAHADGRSAEAFGLSHTEGAAGLDEIDFAIRFLGHGVVRVTEGGVDRGTFFRDYSQSDVFEIAVESGVVQYLRNGAVFYTSGRQPEYPLHADAALYTPGAQVMNAELCAEYAPATPAPGTPTEQATATNTPTPVPPTATPTTAPLVTTTAGPAPSGPLRAAFYYPWFPEAWTQQGIYPYTNYHPSAGYYDGSDSAVLARHIAAMQYGHITAGIASWWGQGTATDGRIPALLRAAAGTGFQWSLYYEKESLGDPSVSELQGDLAYIQSHYAANPAYLRINGRPVLFVFADAADGCGMATRWRAANTSGFYVVLKVFNGYRTCADQPDGWHQYGPAVAADSQKGYSYTISPGFWKVGESPRLVRDTTRWQQNVQAMVASGAPLQLITTFNEWGEGTAVESAQEWATGSGYGAYLDILHNNP